jgi:hypothetical protein
MKIVLYWSLKGPTNTKLHFLLLVPRHNSHFQASDVGPNLARTLQLRFVKHKYFSIAFPNLLLFVQSSLPKIIISSDFFKSIDLRLIAIGKLFD